MRILYVSNSGFQYLAPVLPALERLGARTACLSTDEFKAHQKRFAGSKIRILRQYYFDRGFVAAFRGRISEFNPDVVHVTGLRSTLIKTLAALSETPIPIVHERISVGGINVLSPLDRRLFTHPRIKRIVMPSKAMLNNWMGNPFLRFIRPERCEVLHYPFELPQPADAAKRLALRQSLGFDPEAFVIGTVCHIRPIKNVDFIADIVSSLDVRAPVQLAVIGPEGRKGAYGDLIRRRGGERLKLLGYIPDASRMMPAFDLYVSPTRLPGESFGMAFAEAMAHGVPGITMNYGASAEVCEHGVSGLALPPSKASWREAIMSLMADRERLAAMGQAARARIADHFSPDGAAANYLALYRQVVAE